MIFTKRKKKKLKVVKFNPELNAFFQIFLEGACPQTPLAKTCFACLCTFPLHMSDQCDDMSEQMLVWPDIMSDHFRKVIIVSENLSFHQINTVPLQDV